MKNLTTTTLYLIDDNELKIRNFEENVKERKTNNISDLLKNTSINPALIILKIERNISTNVTSSINVCVTYDQDFPEEFSDNIFNCIDLIVPFCEIKDKEVFLELTRNPLGLRNRNIENLAYSLDDIISVHQYILNVVD